MIHLNSAERSEVVKKWEKDGTLRKYILPKVSTATAHVIMILVQAPHYRMYFSRLWELVQPLGIVEETQHLMKLLKELKQEEYVAICRVIDKSKPPAIHFCTFV